MIWLKSTEHDYIMVFEVSVLQAMSSQLNQVGIRLVSERSPRSVLTKGNFCRPQWSCGKVMFLHLCVILFKGGGSCPGGLCPGGFCPGGLCPGVLCKGGLCLGGLCPGGVSVQVRSLSWEGLCPGGSLSTGLSVLRRISVLGALRLEGSLSQGVSV